MSLFAIKEHILSIETLIIAAESHPLFKLGPINIFIDVLKDKIKILKEEIDNVELNHIDLSS